MEKRSASEDEIDLDAGCILLPDCIIQEGTPGEPPIPPGPQPPVQPPPTPPPGGPPPEPGEVRSIRIDMRLTKPMLFKTFSALGNLADKSGEIQVTVEGTKDGGFDRNWLRNAVKEPLEEAGIELEITEK